MPRQLLDTRRNLLTTVLVAGLAALALVAAGTWLLLGRVDVESIEPVAISEVDTYTADTPDTALAELSQYAVITDRPVFFEDRRLPVIENVDDDEVEVAEVDEPDTEIPALEAKVSGIMITSEFKLAMVSDGSGERAQVLREGMALEGELAGWRLAEIHPRSVRFVAEDGNETSVEMEVETRALAVAPDEDSERSRSSRRGNEMDTGESASEDADVEEEARARAEEVRRRVAERRAQLRAEAERRAREREQEQQQQR